MTTEALGVDIYIPVTFATGGTPVNNFGTAPTLLSAARNGTAFTPSSTTVSANGTAAQSYGYTLQGSETTLQGAGKYTLVFQCLDATADYPIWLVEVDIGQAWVTSIATLVSRIGAFTGSGVNTVLGFLKALMSKTASTPSDVGGTFDAATDSTEAIRDRGDAAWTGGGATAEEIREEMDAHSERLDAIQDKTDLIGSGWVRRMVGVSDDGREIMVTRGGDHKADDGLSLDFAFDDSAYDFTGASVIQMTFVEPSGAPISGLTVTGSVLSAKRLRFEPTKAQTLLLPEPRGSTPYRELRFELKVVLASGNTIFPVPERFGRCIVLR